MTIDSLKLLAEGINEYFSQYELEELCGHYEIVLEYVGTSPNHQRLAKQLLGDLNAGQNRRFLIALLEDMLIRCDDRIHIADRESKLYHQQMEPHLNTLKRLLTSGKIPSKKRSKMPSVQPASKVAATAPKRRPALDRDAIVDFFRRANTAVTIVDTELGAGIFDCLEKVESRINLLTSQRPENLGKEFNEALKLFTKDGRKVEVRLRENLHDRYIVFNNRCWLTGMSLKESSSANFKPTEIVDLNSLVIERIEQTWRDAEVIIIG